MCVGSASLTNHLHVMCVGSKSLTNHLHVMCVGSKSLTNHLHVMCVGAQLAASQAIARAAQLEAQVQTLQHEADRLQVRARCFFLWCVRTRWRLSSCVIMCVSRWEAVT
jgi:hypothetical protein